MSNNNEPVAVAISDLHLSAKPPVFRSLEEDWIEIQRSYLKQAAGFAKKRHRLQTNLLGTVLTEESLPLIIAGDLFDRSSVPPEVISLALTELPNNTYAIPGNHDLPSHRYEEMYKSAYGVLVAAGKIKTVDPNEPMIIEGDSPIRLHGFPCGYPVKPLEKPHDLYLEIAVVHDYLWHSSHTGYMGAPEEKRLRVRKYDWAGYDVIIYGDNHCAFQAEINGASVINSGGLMIRKSDERDYKPSAWLIYSDGSVERCYLDTSQDKYLEVDETLKMLEVFDSGGFIDELMALGDKALDVASALHRLAEAPGTSDPVKQFILRSLNKGEMK